MPGGLSALTQSLPTAPGCGPGAACRRPRRSSGGADCGRGNRRRADARGRGFAGSLSHRSGCRRCRSWSGRTRLPAEPSVRRRAPPRYTFYAVSALSLPLGCRAIFDEPGRVLVATTAEALGNLAHVELPPRPEAPLALAVGTV